MDQSYHYKLIARAIALIDAPGGTARSLDDLAAELGLSAAHFQRVFSAWAGVSPKRYQQYLTLGHARQLLAARFSTFDTALQLGLSGQARLHDLFLRWEGMTPGDYAKRGEGLEIHYGWFDSPFGPALGLATDRGLCGLAFAENCDDMSALADMTRRWPKARYRADPAAAAPHVDVAFARKGTAQLHMIGTPFQIKVWEAFVAGAARSCHQLWRGRKKPSVRNVPRARWARRWGATRWVLSFPATACCKAAEHLAGIIGG